MDIHRYLQLAAEKRASDLHLKVQAVPTLRIDGILVPIEGEAPLTPDDTHRAFMAISTEKQREKFIEPISQPPFPLA